ncbi:hypothetical protein Tco_0016618 [Tanacetum coccineum]
MVDDMLKAQSKVIDILCNLELIYPPAFFDIMIHLVIHLPLEAVFGGPIRPWWMYPFERYMKKLKNYVQNKAKSEGSIAKGYIAEEALKKVRWYVLHNSPEIDTYRAKFKSEFPDNDIKEAFPGWFGKQIRQRHIDNDPGVSESSELFALACGPSQTPISVNSCVVNGVRFVVHSRDERRTTQNSGICSPAEFIAEPTTADKTNHSKSGLGLPSIVALVMVIDKSWTSLGKHEKAFYTGLKKFVDDCKPLVDSAGNIRCPCKSCRLVLWVSIKHLSDHISKYGFDPSYKTWIHHGEPDLPPPPPVIDNTRQPQMSDMTACLNDLNYIPLNNEQNEPTQGDIGETSNDPTQAKRNEFEELYASANEELYPGCDKVNRKVDWSKSK